MNLKPRVSSNFSAALIRPRLPSLIRAQALVLVLFRNGYHEPQVRAGQFLEGHGIALADPLGEFHFLFRGHQFLAADLLEVFVQGCTLAVGDGLGNLQLSHLSVYNKNYGQFLK